MVIVGKEEVQQQMVSVRKRRQGDTGKSSLSDFVSKLKTEIKTRG
jgi:threonyl-tRNA synthetase